MWTRTDRWTLRSSREFSDCTTRPKNVYRKWTNRRSKRLQKNSFEMLTRTVMEKSTSTSSTNTCCNHWVLRNKTESRSHTFAVKMRDNDLLIDILENGYRDTNG